MMAPNPSGVSVLGRHHPAVKPRTTTGKLRLTARPVVSVHSSEMATRVISIAIENNRMRPEWSMSQINRYVVLNKSYLFGRKVLNGTDCVQDASAPGIPGAGNASN